tara:strand:+ start:1435 stop:1716 length:282 start_codon:yes stop_codon:yes gene_type:complete
MLGFIIPIILTEERDDVWGEWDGGAGTITLNAKASEDLLQVTFLHEAIHAIESFLGLNINHKDVYCISQILWVMFKENPALTEWFFQNLRKEH